MNLGLLSIPRRSFLRTAALVTCVCWMLPLASLAHDVWIEPVVFRPELGKETPVRIFVGDLPEREEVPFRPDRVVRWEVLGGSTAATLTHAKSGMTPAATLRVLQPGTHWLVYETKYSVIELDAEKFNDYLREDGLDEVLEERRKTGEIDRPAKEKYRRFCKALVGAGTGAAADLPFVQRAGLAFELIPETDPRDWQTGKELVVRAEFQGSPIAGVKVKLVPLDDLDRIQSARTDASGQVRFTPAGAGRCYAGAVHMRRAPDGLECDWESFWATCSFEIGGSVR